jgi:T3SS negative regulator,GrlR
VKGTAIKSRKEVYEMVEGFWTIEADSSQGSTGGVAVFIEGSVFGGDSGFTYIGHYETNGKTFKARLSMHRFMRGVVGILDIVGDYELDVTGTIEGNVIRASGVPVDLRAASLDLTLTRVADLPNGSSG